MSSKADSNHPSEERPGPLKPVHFQILRVLLDGELHGYAIAKRIAERTEGAIRMEPGNLYRFIRGLVDDGLVRRAESPPAGDGSSSRTSGKQRRAYRITPSGRRALARDVTRMRALVRDAEFALARQQGES